MNRSRFSRNGAVIDIYGSNGRDSHLVFGKDLIKRALSSR
jgi:hypothetical protein